MRKEIQKSNKGFATKEILIMSVILIFIGIISAAIFKKMSDSIVLAQEVRYASYVSQMKKMVESANALNYFSAVLTPDWVCLGVYEPKKDAFCWGSDSILNNTAADNALRAVDVVPVGQSSPYKTINNRGVVFKINEKTIEIKAYVGDLLRTKKLCADMNMIQDPSDPLSCVLPTPIIKN